jgi:transposase
MMSRPRKYPEELRERAVAMVLSSGRPIAHVARDLGIHREALRQWVRRAQADAVPRPSRVLPSDVQEELTRLRREVAELRRANQILKDASVYFAQELDPIRRR